MILVDGGTHRCRLFVQQHAPAVARRADIEKDSSKPLETVLTGHLDKTQIRDIEDLGPGLVPGQGLA